MGNSTDTPVSGWVDSPNGRGTQDILWSCGLTILLCCWVSVYPNVGSPNDKWFHPFLDKLKLFCIGLLGPDFLLGIAFGQWSKARESVIQFKYQPPKGKFEWKYIHAFFVNSGGIHLKSPDFPKGFPINAQQLHYLMQYDMVEPLHLESLDISLQNSVDNVARVITVLQAAWFFVGICGRWHAGLPVTTLELTTISFVVIMFATSTIWFFKPSFDRPLSITTKDSKSIQSIRDFSQREVCDTVDGVRTAADRLSLDPPYVAY
ncbi:uncharacterized protein N7498_001355 [Penicillium cinerascens]|uniref:Uncharacterized protein n=1 Tax=Penicillium cinerascens TaxID=70096 RepID=A0A9W9NG24_9EURO|nr:uncharacterized protein N7498_001355 [Penicillium cinerascens]KAJ5219256.1 hypothetical protein N7498_001355 [Penicillium cinerascens]